MNRLFEFDIVDNCINIDYKYNLGHTAGQGQISPDGKFNFIHIPKNASSEIKTVLGDWQESNYHIMQDTPSHLVILRDPTERWISGIAEFLVGEYSHMGTCNSDIPVDEVELMMGTKMFQNLLFDFVIFDGHTIPQCCYIEGLNLDNITFFYHDEQVIPRILKYVGLLNQPRVKNTNNSLTNSKKIVIIKKLKSLLTHNPKLQHSIDKHYWADHKLFDNVKFYY